MAPFIHRCCERPLFSQCSRFRASGCWCPQSQLKLLKMSLVFACRFDRCRGLFLPFQFWWVQWSHRWDVEIPQSQPGSYLWKESSYQIYYFICVPTTNLRGYDSIAADYSTQSCPQLNSKVNRAAIAMEGGANCREGPTAHWVRVAKSHSNRRVAR